jgi:hypothetical protein
VPTAARREETRNPNEWRRKLPVEAASGLNDLLGSCAGLVAALGRDAGKVDGVRAMDGERT